MLSQLDDARREEALRAYFGRDGLRYSWLRVPVDSCDFSLSSYCAVTDPNDREFQTFSLKRDLQYIVPLLRQPRHFRHALVPDAFSLVAAGLYENERFPPLWRAAARGLL